MSSPYSVQIHQGTSDSSIRSSYSYSSGTYSSSSGSTPRSLSPSDYGSGKSKYFQSPPSSTPLTRQVDKPSSSGASSGRKLPVVINHNTVSFDDFSPSPASYSGAYSRSWFNAEHWETWFFLFFFSCISPQLSACIRHEAQETRIGWLAYLEFQHVHLNHGKHGTIKRWISFFLLYFDIFQQQNYGIEFYYVFEGWVGYSGLTLFCQSNFSTQTKVSHLLSRGWLPYT